MKLCMNEKDTWVGSMNRKDFHHKIAQSRVMQDKGHTDSSALSIAVSIVE